MRLDPLARAAVLLSAVILMLLWAGIPASVEAVALKVSVVGDPTRVQDSDVLEVRYSGFSTQEVVKISLVDLDNPHTPPHIVVGNGAIGYAMVEAKSMAATTRATVQVSSLSNPSYGTAYLPYAFSIAAAAAPAR